MKDPSERLQRLRERGLHRRLREIEGPQGPRVTLGDREVLLLCSNNYLGLAEDPRVRSAAAEAAVEWGAGAGASRLISGNMEPHRDLERRLAEFKGFESALLYGSGYLANTGLLSCLAGRGEVILSDELNHASIIDGCRLSRAETVVYRHADPEHLEWCLEQAGGRGSLIVTDGVFSMDGDTAPLEETVEVAGRHGCRVVVDEAHATGVVGPGGRGSVAAAGLTDRVDLIVGTLGKSLGSYGAYVCGSAEMIELLINESRPFVFSTAPPPPSVAAAAAALGILESGPELVERVGANAAALRRSLTEAGLDPMPGAAAIVPIVIGGADATMRACERALSEGVFAQGIRPPTVPEGSSRLRLTAMATHTEEELGQAAAILAASVLESRAVVAGDPA